MMFRTWDPFREIETLRSQVERAFDEWGTGRGWPFSRTAFLPGISARTYPLLNVSEDKDNVYIEALAPGLNPESLEVTVHQDILRLGGEKPPINPEVKPEAFHRNERSAGRFVRSLRLPVPVDNNQVKAEYKNGLLLITLPKAEEAKPKEITVSVG